MGPASSLEEDDALLRRLVSLRTMRQPSENVSSPLGDDT